MAPPLPQLTEDLVAEVLLCLPPAEPASLFRATALSRIWNQRVSNQDAVRRYREHHGVPPLLGFFQNKEYSDDRRPRFVPICKPSPPFARPNFGSDDWMALGYRHGRLLVHTVEVQPSSLLRVWNPITGQQEEVPLPTEDVPEYSDFTGAVLCAVEGCDHLDCAGGPFRVVFAPTASDSVEEDLTWVQVYSSVTRDWTDPSAIHPGDLMDSSGVMGPTLLLGDFVYFSLDLLDRRSFLGYHLGNGTLLQLEGPHDAGRGMFLVVAEDGNLGVADVENFALHLWSRQAGDEDGWVHTKSFDFGPTIPRAIWNNGIRVVGYAEHIHIVFVSGSHGVSVVDLKSGIVKNLSTMSCLSPVFLCVTFYTHGLGAGFNG